MIVDQTRHNQDINERFPQACRAAHADFSDTTSALCYCLCYQRMHFESLLQILEEGHLDDYIAPLVIDVGAGPGTVPVAVAQRRVIELGGGPIALRYVDIERSGPMRAIAGDYLCDRTLFANPQRHSIS